MEIPIDGIEFPPVVFVQPNPSGRVSMNVTRAATGPMAIDIEAFFPGALEPLLRTRIQVPVGTP